MSTSYLTHATLCLTCLRKGHHSPSCEDQMALAGWSIPVPVVPGAVETPQRAAGTIYGRRGAPVWSVVCIAVGAALAVAGLVFTGTVAAAVWSAIQ